MNRWVLVCALALLLAMWSTGVAQASPSSVTHVVVYEDDVALGHARCREAMLRYYPAICEVQPRKPGLPWWAEERWKERWPAW